MNMGSPILLPCIWSGSSFVISLINLWETPMFCINALLYPCIRSTQPSHVSLAAGCVSLAFRGVCVPIFSRSLAFFTYFNGLRRSIRVCLVSHHSL